jgi:hypothetical protein
MARRMNPAAGVTATEEYEEHLPMAGGAPGVDVAPATAQPVRVVMPAVPVRKHRVMKEAHVMYGNCRTILREGKEVDELTYDLELLRRQGVVLQEV